MRHFPPEGARAHTVVFFFLPPMGEGCPQDRKGASYKYMGFIYLFAGAIDEFVVMPNHVHGIPIWQRNYYDHIIRNENELNGIRDYIRNNPVNWINDDYHAN